MKKNFDMNKDLIIAEPLYILLAAHNHPDAHEHVRKLTLEAQISKKQMKEIIKKDHSIKKIIKKFTKKQIDILNNPEEYTGIASRKTEDICEFWKKKIIP
jgi:adenylosuccinate lyase